MGVVTTMGLGLVTTIVILGAVIGGAKGDAMVSGSVFCDRCKDGQLSLFDFPLSGIKVSIACPGQNGQVKVISEETTNWIGNYVMRFDGVPDMSACRAQVSGDGQGCRVVAGPAQSLNLVFQMFDTEIYTVDHLISQPAQPMSNCPRSSSPLPKPVTPALPPPTNRAPIPQPPPTNRAPIPQPPPTNRAPIPQPPQVPFLEASACSYRMWMMPEYKCYWRVLSPDLKVALVFGPLAGQKYGNDITLRGSMMGRGDPYKTLLRESTAALLNSYNSLRFPYHPLDVVGRLNTALMGGSTRQVLMTALRFLRANSGSPGNVTCKFTTCK
ncbi:putative protodermal factor 1 [Helianthus annuus]|nr:putative protodermal factor 1 [Helianthus annuus]KAJ0636928.1 putative protodermal factor 1 [Helianthus annuus]KAJ0814005.1 putative protodermal factor 1 [Helianthus annuus]